MSLLLKGTVVAPPDKFGQRYCSFFLIIYLYRTLTLVKNSFNFSYVVLNTSHIAGETLQDERINGGTFTGSDSFQLPNKMMPVSWPIGK